MMSEKETPKEEPERLTDFVHQGEWMLGLITKYRCRLEAFRKACPEERGTIAVLENTLGRIENAVNAEDDTEVIEATEFFNAQLAMGYSFADGAQEAAGIINDYLEKAQ